VSFAISTEELTKDFLVGFWRPRPHRALDALSLEIPYGSVFGLLGPNGAGKSTTLKLLLDLLSPTCGRAKVLGLPPGALSARQRLGFLPENPAFYDHLTADELVTYFAGLFGWRGEDRRRRVARALDQAGLGAERKRPLRQFSKGMLQRVGLAQALVNDPELLILDEPMSGLDPIGRRDVRDLILRVRDEGRTVLFSSHILSDAEMLCSRVAILSRGRVMVAGPLAELMNGCAGTAGWEIAMSNIQPGVAASLVRHVRRITRISEGQYNIQIGPHDRAEPLVAELAAGGARLISIVPITRTLEDVFLSAVGDRSELPNPRAATTLAGAA
jgi:ABC-2 type transport system ATP-binding protein